MLDNINIRRVTTLKDAYIVADIRNSGRLNMTGDQKVITPENQKKWWENVDHNKLILFLYTVGNTDTPQGFGLLRKDPDGFTWLLTLAISPEARGEGLGNFIYAHLATHVKMVGDIVAEIFHTNKPSIRAALNAGFVYSDSNEETVTLIKKAR